MALGLPENEAVPLALVINELGTNAIKHRATRQDGIMVRVTTRPDGMEMAIENPGTLKDGFNLAQISASVSGLGLVKALLPRRERGSSWSAPVQSFQPACNYFHRRFAKTAFRDDLTALSLRQ